MHRPGPSLPIFGEPEGTPEVRAAAPWLAMGFRPFFLAAAVHAMVFVPWWLALVAKGSAVGGGYLLPMWWHAHEMLFGFTMAVVAGFLLTAVRNWTGRDTAHGPALGALLALWFAGRVVIVAGSALPAWLIAGTVVAFPIALAAVLGRALIAARSRRNYGVLILLAALALTCALTHLGAATGSPILTQRALLVTVHLIVFLIVFIGGRVIPLFTRTATRRNEVRNVLALDRLALTATGALAIAIASGATGRLLAGVAAFAGASNLLRMGSWGTRFAWRLPMAFILHLGYAWIGAGQLLIAGAAAGFPIAATTALHALTIGVIGTMTLGMMARVALGHSGLPVAASGSTLLAFALMLLATLARLASMILPPEAWLGSVQSSGTAFALAFALYVLAFGRILLSPRVDGEPG